MSYAQPADLLARFDARVIGNLAGDQGAKVEQIDLLTDANVQAALDSASGAIEAALLQGERYQVSDLLNLTGNSQAYLVQICCEIAVAKLYGRRLDYRGDRDQRTAVLKQADDNLELLRTGKNVLNIQSALGATLPEITGPSTPTRRELNLIVDRAAGNFYTQLVQPNNR